MMTLKQARWTDAFTFARTDEEFGAIFRQLTQGRGWKVDPPVPLGARRPLALFGLYPVSGGALEAWFSCSSDAGKFMLQIAWGMRTLLRAETSRPIFCAIKPGHAPGERLAKLLGFAPTGNLFHAHGTPVDGAQFWRYQQ